MKSRAAWLGLAHTHVREGSKVLFSERRRCKCVCECVRGVVFVMIIDRNGQVPQATLLQLVIPSDCNRKRKRQRSG